MSRFTYADADTGGEVVINYEVQGEGFPILLIAPGGMKSAIPFWQNTPYNPMETWSDAFQVIAMDQRNAGGSSGPIAASHGWHTYAQDQLALLDHLGVDRFVVAGMCIGGPYGLGLMQQAPSRVAAGVLFQPIGLDDNRDAFYSMFDGWRAELEPSRPEVSAADWAGLREQMYGGDAFMFLADDAQVADIQTPMVVLMGQDLYHPEASSRRLADTAPNATLIEQWKTGAEMTDAQAATRRFIEAHAA